MNHIFTKTTNGALQSVDIFAPCVPASSSVTAVKAIIRCSTVLSCMVDLALAVVSLYWDLYVGLCDFMSMCGIPVVTGTFSSDFIRAVCVTGAPWPHHADICQGGRGACQSLVKIEQHAGTVGYCVNSQSWLCVTSLMSVELLRSWYRTEDAEVVGSSSACTCMSQPVGTSPDIYCTATVIWSFVCEHMLVSGKEIYHASPQGCRRTKQNKRTERTQFSFCLSISR